MRLAGGVDSRKRQDRDLNPGSQREHAFQACALPLGHPGSIEGSLLSSLSPSLRRQSRFGDVGNRRHHAPEDECDAERAQDVDTERTGEQSVPLHENEKSECTDEPPQERRFCSVHARTEAPDRLKSPERTGDEQDCSHVGTAGDASGERPFSPSGDVRQSGPPSTAVTPARRPRSRRF